MMVWATAVVDWGVALLRPLGANPVIKEYTTAEDIGPMGLHYFCRIENASKGVCCSIKQQKSWKIRSQNQVSRSKAENVFYVSLMCGTAHSRYTGVKMKTKSPGISRVPGIFILKGTITVFKLETFFLFF